MQTAARPPKFTDTSASALLDLVRGLAAVLVLLEHWRNYLFTDFEHLETHGRMAHALWAIPYVVTSAGHPAVVIFFVLSGYLISGSIFRMLERKQWSWAVYLMHRLARLWTVLLPGLLLCALWDVIGLHSGHAPLRYSIIGASHTADAPGGVLSVTAFFGNLFFLYPMLTPIFGSDGALWSLPFEFWYYMLFPLALLAVRKEFSVRVRIGNAALFLLAAWFMRGRVLLMFPMWLLGTVLALLPAPRVNTAVRWVVGLLYLPVVFATSKVHLGNDVYQDYGFSVLTAVFLWVMLGARERAEPKLAWVRSARALSRFSFTLYVVHMPLLVLLGALILGDSTWQPTPAHVVFGLGLLMVALAYAWGIASVTEFRTDKVRAWAEARLLGWSERRNEHEAALEGKAGGRQ